MTDLTPHEAQRGDRAKSRMAGLSSREQMIEKAALRVHAAYYSLPYIDPEWLWKYDPEWLWKYDPEWLWKYLAQEKERNQFRAMAEIVAEVVEDWFDGKELS